MVLDRGATGGMTEAQVKGTAHPWGGHQLILKKKIYPTPADLDMERAEGAGFGIRGGHCGGEGLGRNPHPSSNAETRGPKILPFEAHSLVILFGGKIDLLSINFSWTES